MVQNQLRRTNCLYKQRLRNKGGSNENVTEGNKQEQNNNGSIQTGGSYVVNATSLRVRTGPAAYHSVIGGVLNGTTLNVVDLKTVGLK